MTKDEATARSAMKLALDSLVYASSYCDTYDAITALREALAQERSSDEQTAPVAEPRKQEPVGTYGEIFESMRSLLRSGRQADQQIYMAMQCKPLYTSPPTLSLAQRKPLTDEEWQSIADTLGCFITRGQKDAIEAALGIKENT